MIRGAVRRSLALALVGASLVACTGAAPAVTPSPAGPVRIEITSKTKDELQAVLNAQVAAVGKRDLRAYQATYDGGRAAFRRCKQESFDIAGRLGAPSSAPQVQKVEAYGDAYVRAWVDEGRTYGVSRRYFRTVGGSWVESEPTDSEVGPEKHTTVDGIDIDYWGIDDDVIDAVGKGALAARDAVLQDQLAPSSHPFGIRFYPTRSVTTLVACNVVGYHLVNQPNDKFIRFFRYWFTPDLATLSSPTISFVVHEGLHWAQDQFIPGITARLDWWLAEGWPDHVGKARSVGEIQSVLCRTPTPSFKQLVDGPPDLPETPPEEGARYYSFANTMVEYLYARFGPDAYKQLLSAYKAGVDPKANYPLVLKTTPEEYYAGWLAFAKKKYC